MSVYYFFRNVQHTLSHGNFHHKTHCALDTQTFWMMVTKGNGDDHQHGHHHNVYHHNIGHPCYHIDTSSVAILAQVLLGLGRCLQLAVCFLC